jgi:putative ABC transport system substrate-binding protein
MVEALRIGLSERGFVDGQNVSFTFRWADGVYGQLTSLASDLVRSEVAVIVTSGGIPPALAAKAATRSIPIVFVIGSDPVEFGLVASLSRPGGNVTGVSMLAYVLDAKRLEIMNEIVPNASSIGILLNPSSPQAAPQLAYAQTAAGQALSVFHATSEEDFEPAFATLSKAGQAGILVSPDPFFLSRRERLVALAAEYRVPALYQWRDFAEVGGLLSYGASNKDAYRQAGLYAGTILKGGNPADLPVLQPTTFELIINVRAARALGLTIPPSLLARADEIIE